MADIEHLKMVFEEVVSCHNRIFEPLHDCPVIQMKRSSKIYLHDTQISVSFHEKTLSNIISLLHNYKGGLTTP
jgi:hypothetical protein